MIKRILVTLWLAFCFSQAIGQTANTVAEIRHELFYSSFDEYKSSVFYEKIKNLEDKSPLVEAYEGAAMALKATFEWNPLSKLSYIRESNKTLAMAIERDGKNLEIRFLRFYIQNQTPKYLGFSKNLKEDKQAIMDGLMGINIEGLGKEIIAFIADYMETSGGCSQQQVDTIKTALNR